MTDLFNWLTNLFIYLIMYTDLPIDQSVRRQSVIMRTIFRPIFKNVVIFDSLHILIISVILTTENNT